MRKRILALNPFQYWRILFIFPFVCRLIVPSIKIFLIVTFVLLQFIPSLDNLKHFSNTRLNG